MKRSKIIALAGISSAFALICECGSMFFEPMTLVFATLSAIFVSLPFTKNFWLGGVISYVVCALCAFFIGGIQSVPFIVFFGLYAVVQWLIEYKFAPRIKVKWLKYTLSYILKLIYLEAAVATIWFTVGSMLIPSLIVFGKEIEMTYLIIALGSIPIFLLYDLMMHLVFINLKRFIDKKLPDTEVVSKDTYRGSSYIEDERLVDSECNQKLLEDFMGDSSVTHHMRLSKVNFDKIQSGEKTVEVRLNDSKRQSVGIGDKIDFECVEDGRVVNTKVTHIYHYDSFEQLYSNVSYDKLGYQNKRESNYKDMYKYYIKEDEIIYGVVAIEIELI